MAEVQDTSNPTAAAPPAPAVAAAAEPEKKDENWKFIPAQPIREDQVQNAVNFLSHPKVKGSPVVYRRSFLERKGLSREEIDEAFRRCPDPPSDSKTGQLPAATAAAPTAPPASSPAAAVVAAPQLVAVPVQPSPSTALIPSKKGPSWSQLVLAVGLLSAAGAGAAVATKNYLFPRMKAWLRAIVLDEEQLEQERKKKSMAELEAVTKASAANNAVGDMVALVRELTTSKVEERRYFDGILKSLENQTREIKVSLETQTREIKRSLAGLDAYLQKSGTANATVSEANGFSSPDTYKASLYNGQATKVPFGAPKQPRAVRPSSAPSANNPPHSPSYMEVMAMLERGEKPPGIREVNDKPPNANQPPSSSVLQPKAKPWENVKDDNVGNGGMWWRPTDKRVENTVKIVEIESEEGSGSSSMNGGALYETRPAWVPPPVPKTILPGVDAAIRHKATVVEPDQSSDFSSDSRTILPEVDNRQKAPADQLNEPFTKMRQSELRQPSEVFTSDNQSEVGGAAVFRHGEAAGEISNAYTSDKPEDVVVSEIPEY